MKESNLCDEFIRILGDENIRRAELVSVIADILGIEKECASRRLSGKVQFTANEIGVLAGKMNISLDLLLYKDSAYRWIPLIFSSPMEAKTMDTLYDIINNLYEQIAQITVRPSVYVSIFKSLPLNFFIYHPVLMKFMFFMWGYYFVGTKEFNKFSGWELPEKLKNIKETYEKSVGRVTDSLYIWDENIIWSLVNEISKFHLMHILTSKEKDLIKSDLRDLLNNLELHIKGIREMNKSITHDLEFYVTSISLGLTATYLGSDINRMFVFGNGFAVSPIIKNPHECLILKDWIYSLRKVSYLLSNSGPVQRRLFFEKQHKIIDFLLE